MKRSIFIRIYQFYAEGFRNMTVGKTLWLVIFIKLFIIFILFRLLFFHDFLNTRFKSDEERSAYVIQELTTKK